MALGVVAVAVAVAVEVAIGMVPIEAADTGAKQSGLTGKELGPAQRMSGNLSSNNNGSLGVLVGTLRGPSSSKQMSGWYRGW